MKEEERIKRDINLFEGNIKEIKEVLKEKGMEEGDEEIVDLAERYYEDAKYYYDKKDLFTAFGCINYAHGLIDGLKKKKLCGKS
ncbi:MAG: DUF357 domain-containing protein [Candidatus Methanospirareceae archaeon]